MISISSELRKKMRTQTKFMPRAIVKFQDGTQIDLPASRFCTGRNTLVDSASTSGFPIGVALCRTLSLHFFNADGALDVYNFLGAEIDLRLSVALSSTTETLNIGKFTVISPETKGSEIIVTASDNMWKADKPFSTNLTFPTTAWALYQEICTSLGLSYTQTSFRNSTFTISEAPTSEYTYRQILGYIAMIAGGNVRVNRSGAMEILEYNTITQADHTLDQWLSNPIVDAEDITITGASTTVDDVEYLSGSSGYVLQVSNPLFSAAPADGIAVISGALNGLTFRKFSGQYIGNPTIEFMDTVSIVRNGKIALSFVTDMEYTVLGGTEIGNSAENTARNNATYSSPETKAIIEAKKLVGKERTAREQAIQNLAEKLAAESGMFQTAELQADGSSIIYLHNKPTLKESDTIIKITSEAIGISNDFGKTYPYGFTLDGEFISRILSTDGINAEWISMDGRFTNKAQVYLAPGKEEEQTIKNHILNVEKIPDEKIPLYDFSGDGSITVTDLVLCKAYMLGKSQIAEWSGVVKTTITVVIDLAEPKKAIRITGVNMWGREIDVYFGTDGSNINTIFGDLLVGGSLVLSDGTNDLTLNADGTISGVKTPEADDDAATKAYVDEKVASAGGSSSGAIREFDSGAISVGSYSYSGINSKFYMLALQVTDQAGRESYYTTSVTYREIRYLNSQVLSWIVPFISGAYATMKATLVRTGSVSMTFSVESFYGVDDVKIAYVEGFN